MIIQLEDGRKLEVPDGASSEDIDATITEVMGSGPKYYASIAGTPATQQQPPTPEFKPDIKPLAIPSTPLPVGMTQSAIDAANARTKANNSYEQSFVGDEERQRLKALEADRPLLSSMYEGLKHIGKEFAAGTAAAPSFLPQTVQDILNYQPFGDNLPIAERKKAIADDMAKHNAQYEITSGEHPLATGAGESLPFLLTGAAGERGLVRIGESLSNPLKKASIGLNKAIGNTAEATRIANLPKRLPTEYEQSMNAILRGSATGAAEGAGQYDKTAAEGAGTAALGGFAGMFGPLKVLNKVRNERDAAGRKLIDEMHQEGFQITPGIRTGNKALQTGEAGMRNSDVYGQEFANAVDRPNQRVMTRMAGDAIGLDTRDRDLLSQKELSDHMDNLKSQYTALEQNTTGKLGMKGMRDAGEILEDLKPTANRNTSPLDKQRHAIVKSIYDQFKKEVSSPQRGKGGRFEGYVFDGSQYQAIRQRIQDEAGQAYNNGDKRLGDSLSKMRNVLDESLTSGMSKASAEQWKDLNERYAMTKMLLKNGLTASGGVDPTKLTSAMMASDEAARTLTGKGGRIKQFQNIARYNDVLHGPSVEGGSLTGLGKAEPAVDRGFFSRAYRNAVKPIDLLGMSYRLNTNRTPFIGRRLSPAHGLSPTASIQLSRALNQTETPKDYVVGKYQDLLRALGQKQ